MNGGHNHPRTASAADISLRCLKCRSNFIARYPDAAVIAAEVWDAVASGFRKQEK